MSGILKILNKLVTYSYDSIEWMQINQAEWFYVDKLSESQTKA